MGVKYTGSREKKVETSILLRAYGLGPYLIGILEKKMGV